MARQSLLPGVGWINETGTRQALLPGGAWINETAATNMTGTFAATQTAGTMAASGKEIITGTFTPLEAADTMSASGTFTLSFTGTATMLQAADMMAAVGKVPFVPKDVLDNTSTIFRFIRKKKPTHIDLHAAQEKHSAALKASIAELFFPKLPDSFTPDFEPTRRAVDAFETAFMPPPAAEAVAGEAFVPPENHELELLMLLA